jgi:Holliday junction resolvase
VETEVSGGIGVVYKRVDSNQVEIVKELRRLGMEVEHLHSVGKGCPDILVGWKGKNCLLEIKKDDKAKLTPDQVLWHHSWKGQVAVVTNVIEAVKAVKEVCREP